MGLLKATWMELWRQNRGGGILTLAFWYTIITTLYQYLVASRLGPSLPKSLINFASHPGTAAVFPHLTSVIWIKLILVYLTFLVVILPYTIGGLYGGVAEAIQQKPQFTRFLAFFRFGYVNFWRALTQIVLALCYAVIVMAILAGVVIGLGALGSGSPVVSVIAIIIAMAGLFWLIGTLLYWFGQTFSTDTPPFQGWLVALRWGVRALGPLYRQTLMLAVTLVVALIVVTLLAANIPVIGEIILVLVLGLMTPAFVAIYAMLMYRNSLNM